MKRLVSIILVLAVFCCIANAETLKKGSKGEEVKAAQQRLIELGYLNGSADGQFGNKTEEAVKHFRAWNVLGVSGEIDDDTLSALMADSASPFPNTMGVSTSEFIKNIAKQMTIIDMPETNTEYRSGDEYSRAVSVLLNEFCSITVIQCGGQVVEFIANGIGDGSQNSGMVILLTFCSILAASNKSITMAETADLIMTLYNGEDQTVNGVHYTYTIDNYVGNLMTGSVID